MPDFYGPENTTQTGAFWHPVPTYRGTYNILSACLVTIGLCVWSALHLNVPGHGKASTQWWRKLKWLFVGLFAPELVAWTAFRQHRAACKLYTGMRARLGQDIPDGFGRRLAVLCGTGKRRRDAVKTKFQGNRWLWTMTHSHYAVMGGFALIIGETNPPGYFDRFLPTFSSDEGVEVLDRLTITPDGLEYLASLDIELLPNISESEIRDKSNANGLGKALVCIQAFWFCVQCVTRLCQGLEISLLELNTFAHAICALLMYLLWWHKPLDIEEPTLIQGVEKLPAIALLCMASEFGYKRRAQGGHTAFLRPTFRKKPLIEPPDLVYQQGVLSDRRTKYSDTVLDVGQELHGFYIPRDESIITEHYDENGRRCPGQEDEETEKSRVCLHLKRGQVRCLQLASQAISRYDITTFNFKDKDGILQNCIPDRPEFSGLSLDSSLNTASLKFLLGFSIAGCVYGGLHLSAWNAPFPTATQRHLWRLSGIVLVSSGPVMILRLAVEHFVNERKLLDHNSWCWCLAYSPILISWFLSLIVSYGIYILARVYLVVECFVMLWHLPDGVYAVPRWTEYLPHIA